MCIVVRLLRSKKSEAKPGAKSESEAKSEANEGIISPGVKKLATKTVRKRVIRAVNWRSIWTRLSPHQLLMGLDALSENQKVIVKDVGFGSILKLKTDNLPSKLSHFVVDKFSEKEMVIKLNSGNKKVDEDVISGLLGLRNSGVVLNCQRKEKKKDKKTYDGKKEKQKEQKGEKQVNIRQKKGERGGNKEIKGEVNKEEEEDDDEKCGTYGKWTKLYEGCAVTPSRIVERIIDNQDEVGIIFKYDLLALFMNTMVEIKKDGTCTTEFPESLGEDIVVEDVNWCKYICDTIKISKDGWQRDSMSKYFNGALTILVMIYVVISIRFGQVRYHSGRKTC
ncbi:hypothetical protein HanXRQr2_Chr03g0100841 [Helianthus annuus]|uniref:Uncharacterized protein n=1 Tax=Helianthus annuus TaxID=4232 RepID=A0A9K3JFE0_HELAN|nr:hypothetical protein HanXRQr2_Chr03g0100841 [Helianthus annuus]KAJ0592355.1 hypothetical protein HanHA300_Chr03g0084081 [Helianthus annuus]KAJ0599887.1 hypothetical protein HanIR_Chr03g0110221 [Helianthus annuus]KAJ0607342.1 hypothetical protein HanHA89_Chr03g0095591 [Helianthus annuus]KAJ0767397.1 hypothetical protein HanLR1_Chr03g0088851 [Helianthus annuus]